MFLAVRSLLLLVCLCEQAEQAVILVFCIEVSENDPNEFPMPPNLRIDTKIRLVGCSEQKLQAWPLYGHLSGHKWLKMAILATF